MDLNAESHQPRMDVGDNGQVFYLHLQANEKEKAVSGETSVLQEAEQVAVFQGELAEAAPHVGQRH